jgi:metallo-beta-lactamase family protein
LKISFHGASKIVTGSCYLIETQCCKFLVDCGLFQGKKTETDQNESEFRFPITGIDFMILSHAHIDHSGRIPLLYKRGYKNSIYATRATAQLCGILLPDSGHIQESEAEWKNRKRERAGKQPLEPLYTSQDAISSLSLFNERVYDEVVKVNDNVRIRFNDAGHMLGSSITEIWITEDGKETKLVFSGDLGKKDTAILRNPTAIKSADYLIMETTYGDRLHSTQEQSIKTLFDAIIRTADRGGNIIIPSFAVGRTQEMIYYLNKHKEEFTDIYGSITKLPVYIDSPLATSATEIFRNNLDLFDEEAREYIKNGENPLDFPGLRFTKTSDESKALNSLTGPKIIISSSGMCDAGRIKHHLKHNLWRPESTVVFVGYQAPGTLGRYILDGARFVKIFGEVIEVKAEIVMIDGFSGHADKNGLLEWIGSFDKKPGQMFLVHGEEGVIKSFSDEIISRFGIKTLIPALYESYIINAFEITQERKSEFEGMTDILADKIKNQVDAIDHEYRLMQGLVSKKTESVLSDEAKSELYKQLVELEGKIVDLMT